MGSMVYCNKCKHEFEVKVKTKHIENDVEEVFFNCPHCHERYTAYYTNDKIKQLQKILLPWGRRNGKTNITKQIEAITKQIEAEMKRLEGLFSTQ